MVHLVFNGVNLDACSGITKECFASGLYTGGLADPRSAHEQGHTCRSRRVAKSRVVSLHDVRKHGYSLGLSYDPFIEHVHERSPGRATLIKIKYPFGPCACDHVYSFIK
jgi:hypothetical protein